MDPTSSPPSCRPRGFTLIELMIAVAIVAILAAVALPSFLDSIRKGRRSEAFTAINQVQQALERWRSNNATYTTALTTAPPGGLGLPATTTSGYYTISIDGASASAYEVRATAVSGTSQAKDGNCTTLGVRLGDPSNPAVPLNLTYAGTSLAYAASNPCWSR